MILEDNGMVRKSLLKVLGRETELSPYGKPFKDWLIVDYNGKKCKVGAGFYNTTHINFTLPEYAIIQHVAWDNDNLRFPVFIEFDFKHKF